MKSVPLYCTEENEIDEGASSYENQKEMQGNIQAGGKQQITTLSRRLSSESQDFEFNKLGDLTSPYNIKNQLQEGVLASADELFYKGQLLPLQYTPRPHYNSFTNSPISPCSDTIETLSSKLTQDVRFSSCRMDHVGLDSSLLDFSRCSSFRSQSSNYSSYYCNYYANYGTNCSNYWDSSTISSAGECSSSSRDSNGSSLDSCSHSDNNKEQHVWCHGHKIAGLNGSNCQARRKSGFMQSWKLLFNGFRRGSSSSWGDHQVHNSSFHGSLTRPSTENTNPNPKPGPVAKNQGGLDCGCKGKDKRCMDERPTTSACRASKGSRWQGYTRKMKPISMIRATLVGGHGNERSSCKGNHHPQSKQLQQEQSGEALNKGRFTRQPLHRRFSQPSISVPGVKGPSNNVIPSFRFHGPVSTSCPASVRSSPSHSGLLSPSLNINNNMSTIQELHSAVQGAIAHCKQSISARSPF